MENIFAIPLMLAGCAFCIGLVFILARSSRALGKRLLGYGAATFVLSTIGLAIIAPNNKPKPVANSAEFQSWADKRAASKAGMTAKQWNDGRAAREQAAAEVQAAIEAHHANIASIPNCSGQAAKILAYKMSQDFVRQQLKSPTTAVFPSSFRILNQIETTSECSFKITAWVDAQNSFGAQTRTHYSAILKQNGQRWTLIALDL